MTGSTGDRGPVIVGVDGSQSALRAVRWGATEAARRQAALRLVTAVRVEAAHVVHPQLMQRYRSIVLDRSRGHLDDVVAAAEQEAPGVGVQQQLVEGHPIPVLGAESDRAQLVVIGDRGMGRTEGVLVGSVAVALAAHASSAVVVVRGVREPSETVSLPVVVGVDGSPTSDAAVAFAYEAASARRVPLVAVHTWWDLLTDPVMAPLLDLEAIEDDERQLLSQRLAGWSEKYPDVPVERVVTRDRPAHSLLEQAAGAQLLVVGSRGRGGLSGLVLGSVSHAVVHRSPCPVAVVRPDTTAGQGPLSG